MVAFDNITAKRIQNPTLFNEYINAARQKRCQKIQLVHSGYAGFAFEKNIVKILPARK
jgi:hypothetical protein